ncbi:MAG: hypothetical protein ABI671_16140 [Burkholderiales bacterium]
MALKLANCSGSAFAEAANASWLKAIRARDTKRAGRGVVDVSAW